MSKALIIAEKPSVATDLQRVLAQPAYGGKFTKEKDYFENEKLIISSAIGHLVEQQLPMGPNGKPLPWKFDCLPVIPDKFDLQPIEKTKSRLAVLVRLMKRSDVSEIINACDAGREGELIFRYIMAYSRVSKPVRRLWMQSMTNQSILEAFKNLRSDTAMLPLADAALCRSESDWLVGINSTRAMTAYRSRYGGFNKTPVGRVQTPTLAILARREQEIENFVSRDYFEVQGDFAVRAGHYLGRWFDETFKSDPNDAHKRAERLWDRSQAEAIVKRCLGREATIEEVKKPSRQIPPLLYDLTSLQREANGRFGFSARRTLQLAQSLYERHKAITYPRTDSRYLPEDYLATTKGTLGNIASGGTPTVSNLPAFARNAINQGMVRPNRRIFDNTKVSDHFAIIPTGELPKHLDEVEQKLFDLITRRFVAVFYPAAEFEITTRISRIDRDAFKTDGKVLVVPGWLEVYGRDGEVATGEGGEDGGKSIVPVVAGETAHADPVEVQQKATKPPPRYNESTLLSAMEGAGKLIDDDELREAMSERGLGTPATRASVIEGLIEDQYVARNGRELCATHRGVALIDQLHAMEIEILTSPEMTGGWEYKLNQMEHGRLDRLTFMGEIKALTSRIVEQARGKAREATSAEHPTFAAACPVCGTSPLGQDEGRYKCTAPDCKFTLQKTIATRPLSEAEVKELLSKKFVGPLTGFVSRFRKPFDAALELQEDKKAGFKIAFVFPKSPGQEAEAESVSPENKLCPCPVCGKRDIYEAPESYICGDRAEGGSCKGRLSKEICKFQIPRDQAIKFFTEGKTDFIEKFLSKRGRPFTARLVCDTKGKRLMNFEFKPRGEGEGGAAKKGVTKKAAAKKTSAKKKTAKTDAE